MKLSEILSSVKAKLPEGGAATLNKPIAHITPLTVPGNESKTAPVIPEETINAVAPSVNLSIKLSDMEAAFERLASLSGADTFTDAMEVAWFNIDAKDKKIVALMSMLTTIYRCSLDGAVTPKIDIEDHYRKSRERVMGMTNSLRPKGPAYG